MIRSTIPAKISSAACQPTLSIRLTPIGENRNCPNEPAAVPARNEIERRADQAAAAAGRGTGFSTIGRLISAEATPKKIDRYHTDIYEPVASNTTPPR